MIFAEAMLEAVVTAAGGAGDSDGVEGVDVSPALGMGALRGGK